MSAVAPSAPFEQAQRSPIEALRFYAAGKHFDVVEGRTRILDAGAIAPDALKQVDPAHAGSNALGADFGFRALADVIGERRPTRAVFAAGTGG